MAGKQERLDGRSRAAKALDKLLGSNARGSEAKPSPEPKIAAAIRREIHRTILCRARYGHRKVDRVTAAKLEKLTKDCRIKVKASDW